ncbi:Hypothetical predicted protein [Pelobates cultripes]|uniref:Uncharacterized protein n=1 Tax=Pelobates cultripes TaxID=61616 RepID=A0AAD1R2V3_PELCU|nr:Hypothetical predicted protein [Pelobates cultripes]
MSERMLNKTPAKRTTPALTPPTLSCSKGGFRMITANSAPKRRRQRDRQHRQKRKACPISSTHTHLKPPRRRTGPEAPCPSGQRPLPDKANLRHYRPDAWHLAT